MSTTNFELLDICFRSRRTFN